MGYNIVDRSPVRIDSSRWGLWAEMWQWRGAGNRAKCAGEAGESTLGRLG
ncbi:hypothetical protein [Kamptonema formosum]|nr:hypothetical protein [Oscillatoria sp. PCC 10802]